MMDENTACQQCGHTKRDHGDWLEDRKEAVQKVRKIGCRIIGCECSEFRDPSWYVDG
jgi:hypothetical protein